MQDDLHFDITKYQEQYNSEEFKKQQLSKLMENTRIQRSLAYENRNILSTLSNSEDRKKVFELVEEVYVKVLESDTNTNTIQDIVINTVFGDDLVLLQENKHMQHFPTRVLFERQQDNPNQKKLVKSRHLSKRSMNKQKTPQQTITYAYSAKSASDKDDRMNEMERQLRDMQYNLSMLALQQDNLSSRQTLLEHQTNINTEHLAVVEDRLCVLENMVTDDRKKKLCIMYLDKPEMKIDSMSKELGVSVRTTKRWLKELKSLGVIPDTKVRGRD